MSTTSPSAPTGALLATTGDDGYLKLWDPATSEELARWGGPEEKSVWGPSFSPDGSQVAAAWLGNGLNGTVRVFDVKTHAVTMELTHLDGPFHTSFSPDGSRLAIALRGETAALVVDPDTGDHMYAAEGHHSGLTDAVFSPDGRWLATASG